MTTYNTPAITDLAGFPMVLAVTPNAINEQFAKIFGEATHQKDTFPKTPWKVHPDHAHWYLIVKSFDSPTIDFESALVNGCRLNMKIREGAFVATSLGWDDDGNEKLTKVERDLAGITVSTESHVDIIHHDHWKSTDFSVQTLFMDLTKIRSVEIHVDEKHKDAISGGVKVGIETVLQEAMEDKAKDDPQALVFGHVLVPKTPDSEKDTGPLKPTMGTFSVTKATGNHPGALNYLLLTDTSKDVKFPTALTAGKFGATLVQDGEKGTLVISDAAVLEHFLKPAILTMWPGLDLNLERGSFPAAKAKLGISGDHEFGTKLDGHDRSATLTKLEAHIDGAAIEMSYSWKSSVYHWSGDIDVEISGTQTINVAIKNRELVQSIVAPEPHIATTDDNLAARIMGDILTLGFDEIGRKDTSDDGKKSMQTITKNILSDAKASLDRFILPGKSVWSYESAKLDGQLYINVTYK